MEKNIHLEVLPGRQRKLLDLLGNIDWLSDFYLAGGTALALQIGHRRSIDFDFFSEREFDVQLLKRKIAKLGKLEISSESDQTINGVLDSIRISFFNLPYPLVADELYYRNIRIASKKDIAAMKLAALSSRGNRKDFVDLYFLLQEFSLAEMFSFFVVKYGENRENVYCVLKGLVYFEDAEEQPMPSMIKNIRWGQVKKAIIQAHKEYIKVLKG